jgi:polysaccharide export outer membrane protein
MVERVNLIGILHFPWRRAILCCMTFAAMSAVCPRLFAQNGAPLDPQQSVGAPVQSVGSPKPVLETPQETNQRLQTLTMGARNSPHDYIIGSGDLLGITVFDVPELTREVRVSQSGTISIPLVPVRLGVSGLTELQAEQKIGEVLEANGLVSHPEVGVMVKEHRSKPITIVGAVSHPMVYEADRSVTLLEALAEAGGISPDAGDTVIVSRVSGATYVEIPNPSPIPEQPAPGAGVLPGEPTGAIPTADNNKQASFPSATNMAQPGDTATARTNSSSGQPSNTITINLNELLEAGDMRNNIVLRAGDVITVPHAGIIYVLGAVSRPGGFVLANDRSELTALKVLSLAGGTTRIAKLKHAVIIRTNDQGKQTQTEVDLKSILDLQTEDVQMRASDILYIPDDRAKEALLRTAEIAIGIATGVALYRLAYH